MNIRNLALISALALITLPLQVWAENGDVAPEPRSVNGVQIGAEPEPRPALPPGWKPPLDRTISVHMLQGSLRAFLEEVGQQSKLEFIFVPPTAVDECLVTAFLQNITSREALQLALNVRGMTYQQAGRSNVYVITLRSNAKFCERVPPTRPAEGSCTALSGKPISLDCRDGALSDFADIVFRQSKASFFFWDGAEDFSINKKLREAPLDKAMKTILTENGLKVERLKLSETYMISLRR